MCLHVQRVWDELDQWHSRINELEAEVQELAEEQPERVHILMDELTKPLQLYQTVAKQAEQRTAFINRVSTVMSYPAIIQYFKAHMSPHSVTSQEVVTGLDFLWFLQHHLRNEHWHGGWYFYCVFMCVFMSV